MKKNYLYICFIMVLLASGCVKTSNPSVASAEPGWKFTGGTSGISTGQAAFVSLSIYGGVPYVGFVDVASNSYCSVYSYTNNTWKDNGSWYSSTWNTIIGFSSTGTLYRIFGVYEKRLYLGVNSNTSVLVWDYIVDKITSTHLSEDILYYVYADAVSNSRLTAAYYNLATSSGSSLGSSGFGGPVNKSVSIFAYNTKPYVAFADVNVNSKASVMSYNTGFWSYVGTQGFSDGDVESVSLYVYEGVPYLAFKDNFNGGRASVVYYTGSAWVNLGSAGFSPGAVDYVTLKYLNGKPYIAFQDNGNSGKVSVMVYDGSWAAVGNYGFSPGEAKYISLDMYNEMPCVAFSDVSNSGKAIMMYYR